MSLVTRLLELGSYATVNVSSTETKIIGNESWMSHLFGFSDRVLSEQNGPNNFLIDNMVKTRTKYNGENGILTIGDNNYRAGGFVTPTIKEINQAISQLNPEEGICNIAIIMNEDVGLLHVGGSSFETFQAASQFNGLEMSDINKTPTDGIEIYFDDKTQGPKVALACACGTFVRNYYMLGKYSGQFNALENMKISPLNGYLIWGTDPTSLKSKLNMDELKIPCMVYTQVAGITSTQNTTSVHKLNKLVHQVYTSAVPIDTYGNGGNRDDQIFLAKEFIKTGYIGTIGMGIILHTIDKKLGNTTLERPRINLTLLGKGSFNVPLEIIIECLKEAIRSFRKYAFDVFLNGYSIETSYKLAIDFGAEIVPIRYSAEKTIIHRTLSQIQADNLDITNYCLVFMKDGIMKAFRLLDHQVKLLQLSLDLVNEEHLTSGDVKVRVFSHHNEFDRQRGFVGDDNLVKYFVNVKTNPHITSFGLSDNGEYSLFNKGNPITNWPIISSPEPTKEIPVNKYKVSRFTK